MQNFRKHYLGLTLVAVAALVLLTSTDASAQKKEYIQATAMGTSTQLGRVISVNIIINEYSTEADKAALLEAFNSHGSQGLANALDKMKAKGRISVTGTLGYDLNYIRSFKMPDGSRLIRFATDRPITFGEAWGGSRSMDYQLSIGEITISPVKGKTKGTLLPVAQVKLNKERDIEIETFKNPWNLVNIKLSK